MTDNGRASTGDRRVRRTRASLQRALIELVAEQELSEIGVADVVDRADVSRSTFYDHYRDVHELAEAACASMIDDLLASLTTVDPAPAKPSDPREDPSPALTAFVAGALLGVATDWLQRGCPRPPREMTILTEPLLTALRNSTATATA